jgi:hypothetical protein
MPGMVAQRRVNCKRPGDLLAVCRGLSPLRGTGWDNRCYPVDETNKVRPRNSELLITPLSRLNSCESNAYRSLSAARSSAT